MKAKIKIILKHFIFVLKTQIPDLIITDVMMPVVGGLELIGLLKAINPDVRVIAASGLMHGEIAKNLSNAGAMALLSKPYTADKLLGTLREVLSP